MYTPSLPPSPSELADTGTPLILWVLCAVGAVVLGALAVRAIARRRAQAANREG
ncbi:hypothetical protein [Streptomyces sp. HNM0574]|uniref:hypothetical protein n=1 Tax=Streptomyces sp. HNM0574 TaxID=2714954 RepID=UPI00146A1C2B|nr:hypothetical protein [Streptomyces sp. HNM0574]NLU70501.1 hypothetical protein [Streptomyces sp. HNM0574]